MGVLESMGKNKVSMTYETGLLLLNYWQSKMLYQPFLAVAEDMLELDLLMPCQLIWNVQAKAYNVSFQRSSQICFATHGLGLEYRCRAKEWPHDVLLTKCSAVLMRLAGASPMPCVSSWRIPLLTLCVW
jgi:hypothetical protein